MSYAIEKSVPLPPRVLSVDIANMDVGNSIFAAEDMPGNAARARRMAYYHAKRLGVKLMTRQGQFVDEDTGKVTEGIRIWREA